MSGKRILYFKPPFDIGAGPKNIRAFNFDFPLEINLVLLRIENDTPEIVFCSIDTLYIGAVLTRKIGNLINQWYPNAKVIAAASHSHNSPMLDETKPILGSVNVENHSIVLRAIKDIVSEFASRNYNKSEKISVSKVNFTISTSISRRRKVRFVFHEKRFKLQSVLRLPSNEYGEGELTSQVIKLMSGENLCAIIWIYPCHPVSHPDPRTISSHYIGYVRSKLRIYFGIKDLPIIFLQGASGDIRPKSFNFRNSHKSVLKRLLFGETFDDFSQFGFEKWLHSVWCEVEKACTSFGDVTRIYNSKIDTYFVPLSALFPNSEVSERTFEVCIVQLENIKMIGVSAEPTWQFASSVRLNSSIDCFFGCIGDSYGYLASEKQCIEGGYEARDYMKYFSLGKYTPIKYEKLIANWLYSILHP